MILYQIVDDIEYKKLITSDYKDNYESHRKPHITSKDYE